MSADLFAALTATTLAGSLALLGVLAIRAFVRRWFGAKVAYAIWIVVPLVAFALLLPAPVRPVATVLRVMQSATIHLPAAVAVPAARDWRPMLLCAWIAGALAMVAWFALQQRRYRRSLGRLRARDAGVSRIVLAEANEGCPALVGAWRPRIVLPGDFEQRYTPRERELVLAHEHVHFARGDARINALAVALRCLNWFNPLIHYAASRFRFDQELACDAAVIARFPEARRPYADAMLKTQLAGQARQELRLPVGCQWPSSHPLKERIAMLKQPLPTRMRRVIGVSLVALFGIGGAYIAWAAQSPQPAPPAVTAPDHAPSEDMSYRKMSPPAYPASAVKERISGKVVLKVHVKETGEVESASVVRVEPPEATVLSGAAIAAVMTWRFNPAVHDGVAVADDAEVPMEFNLDDEGAGGEPAAPAQQPLPTSTAASYRRLSAPTYPASAIDNKIEGIVYVAVAIDAAGRVTSATVDHADPPFASVLGAAATGAVKTWQFNAPTHDGKAIDGHALVPLRFAISDPATVKPSTLPPEALDIIDVVAQPSS